VEDDTNSRFGHIVDNASLPMVEFVWHTLLNCSIADNVYNITNSVWRLLSAFLSYFFKFWPDEPVLMEVGREGDASGLLEASCKGISSS
jgi:hypothetical protein